MRLKNGIAIFYYLLKFLSLIPFSISLKTFKTSQSIKSIIWIPIFCVLIFIIEILIGVFANSQQKGFVNVNNFTYGLFITAYCLLLICVTWTIYNSKLNIKIVNELKLVFNHIDKFGVFWDSNRRVKSFLLKFLTSQGLILITDYIYYFLYEDTDLISIIFCTPIVGIKFLFSSAVLMKYDASLVLVKSGFSRVNNILNRKFIKIETPLNEDEIIYWIDELTQTHLKLCDIFEMITNLFSIPIIAIFVFIFFVIESQFLELYRNFNSQTRILKLICALSWSLVRFSELVMVFKDGSDVIKKVCKPTTTLIDNLHVIHY